MHQLGRQLDEVLFEARSRPGDTGFIDPRLTTKSRLAALDPLGASVRIDSCRPPTLARMEASRPDCDPGLRKTASGVSEEEPRRQRLGRLVYVPAAYLFRPLRVFPNAKPLSRERESSRLARAR